MAFADSCATASGLDADAVQSKCFSIPAKKQAAWNAITVASKAVVASAKCFPWIRLEEKSVCNDPDHGCFGHNASTTPLLPILCKAAQEKHLPLPAACSKAFVV